MAETNNGSNAGANGDEIAGADGKTTNEGSNGTGERKAKVQFTPEQQEWLENWGNSMFGKGRTNAESEIKAQFETQLTGLTSQVTDLKAQLETAKAAAAEATTKSGKKEATEEVNQLKAQLEELSGSLKDLKADRDAIRGERDTHATELKTLREAQKATTRRSLFAEAAKDLNFIDVDEVYALVGSELAEDENGETVVMNPKTNRPRINREGDPMSVSEYLEQFAAKKPHLVRAAETTGGTGAAASRSNAAGSNGSQKSEKTSAEIAAMSISDFEAYKRDVMAKSRNR